MSATTTDTDKFESLDDVLSNDRVLDMLDTLGLTADDVRWYIEGRMDQRKFTHDWAPEVKVMVTCAMLTGQSARDMTFHFKFLDTDDVPGAYLSYSDPALPLKAKTVQEEIADRRDQFEDYHQKFIIANAVGHNGRTKWSVDEALVEVGEEQGWEDFEKTEGDAA